MKLQTVFLASCLTIVVVPIILVGCGKQQASQQAAPPPQSGALSQAPPEVQLRMQRSQEEKARKAK